MISHQDRESLMDMFEEIAPELSLENRVLIIDTVFNDTRKLNAEFRYWWQGVDSKEHPVVQKTGGLGEAIRLGYHMYGWTEGTTNLVTRKQMLSLWHEVIVLTHKNTRAVTDQRTPQLAAVR